MDFFNSIFRFSIEELPYVIITLVIAFTIHEFAHAYVAYKFGDSTAKNQGRLTLNPVQHIDPIGALFLLIAGFGWARPVPVNRYHFKNPRLAGILVSLAGPISNLLLATIGVAVIYGSMAAGIADGLPFYVFDFLEFFISINVLLFVFNLIPLPPLDGYRIVEDLVPTNVRVKMTQFEQYGTLIFLILVIIEPLNKITIQPIFSTVIPWVYSVLQSIFIAIFF